MNFLGRLRRKVKGTDTALNEWWNEVEIGELLGVPPQLRLIGPDMWAYSPDVKEPLTFRRANGEVFVLDFPFLTDMGSIPSFAQFNPLLSKAYYGIAYLFHDAGYELNHRGKGWPSFEKNNQILMEVIKTLQEKGFYGNKFKGGAGIANVILTGVKSSIAKRKWEHPTK